MNSKKTMQILYVVLLLIVATAYLFIFKSFDGAVVLGINMSGVAVRLVLLAGTAVVLFLSAVISSLKKLAIEEKFIIFYALLGIVFILFMPYPKTNHEVSHFLRTYEITEGHLFSENGERVMPDNLDAEYPSDLKIDKTNTVNYSFKRTSFYSPVAYLPQIIGVSVGKFFTHKVVSVARSGQIAAFVISLMLLYLSMKMLPFKKYALLMTACMPMFLQLVTSLSAVNFANVMCIVLISHSLYLAYTKDSVAVGDIIVMYITSLALALCNSVYLPFLLMYALVPKKKFKSGKAFFINIFVVYALCVAMVVFWCNKNDITYIGYIKGAVMDFGREIKDLYFSTVGLHFGDGYDFLSPFLVIVYSAVALTVSLSDVRYKPFAKSGIALFLIALVFLLLALTFAGFLNSVSEGAGEDIKYGYCIPILFSLLVIFNIKAVKVDLNVVNHFVLPFTVFMEMLAIYSAVSQIA
jgi:uncharacterized membrane protein